MKKQYFLRLFEYVLIAVLLGITVVAGNLLVHRKIDMASEHTHFNLSRKPIYSHLVHDEVLPQMVCLGENGLVLCRE